MKNLKIFALILLAGTIMFSSCGKDDPEGPTLTIDANVSEAWQGDTLIFTYSVASNEDLELLSYTTTAASIAPAGEIALSGNSVSNQTFQVILPSSGVTAGTLTFTFTATDKDGEEWADTKDVTITLKEPVPDETDLTAAAAFEWARDGANTATGLSQFGLEWNSSSKAVNAHITPASGNKMVILTTAQWTSITTQEGLASVVDAGTAATSYDAVDITGTTGNDIYDDVIATKVGTSYYMLHVTDFNVPSGVDRRIGGDYKN